jgi:Cu-Zn family superoxide dismutase
MPNLLIAANGTGTIDVLLRNVTLNGSPTALLDRDGASLVVHEKPDDYKSDPAGNAGDRIACGVLAGPRP